MPAQPATDHSKVWGTLLKASSSPIRLGLLRGGIGDGAAEDALQEFLLYLIRNDARRLRLFRGRTDGEFVAFVRVVARRFAHRYVKRHWTRRRREERAFARIEPSDRSGPTEAQLLAARRRIEAAMNSEERARLLAVSGLDDSLRPVAVPKIPETTLRRWRRELVAKFGPELVECVRGGAKVIRDILTAFLWPLANSLGHSMGESSAGRINAAAAKPVASNRRKNKQMSNNQCADHV